MDDLKSLLSEYANLSLDDVEKAKLFDRIEVKFVFGIEELPLILKNLSKEYSLLNIAGTGIRSYENHYVDTPDLKMYIDHHNGKLNRYKLRFRTYGDTGNTFFEIKFKSNRGRTIKKRTEVQASDFKLEGTAAEFLMQETNYTPDSLYESLIVDYKRITLVKMSNLERITLDTELTYSHGYQRTGFPNIVIAEVKQPKSFTSSFTTLMHQMHIQPFSFSKYCLGIATIYPDVKANNFKTKIRYVSKYPR